MRYELKTTDKTVMVTRDNDEAVYPIPLSSPSMHLLERLGVGLNASVTVTVSDGDDYEWEWRREGPSEVLVNTKNGFVFHRVHILSADSYFSNSEKAIMDTHHWRTGDRIRPRKKTTAELLTESGFGYADGITRHGKAATLGDLLDAYEIVKKAAGMNVGVSEFFEVLREAVGK